MFWILNFRIYNFLLDSVFIELYFYNEFWYADMQFMYEKYNDEWYSKNPIHPLVNTSDL